MISGIIRRAVDVEREKYFRGGFRTNTSSSRDIVSTRLDVIDGNNVVAV